MGRLDGKVALTGCSSRVPRYSCSCPIITSSSPEPSPTGSQPN